MACPLPVLFFLGSYYAMGSYDLPGNVENSNKKRHFLTNKMEYFQFCHQLGGQNPQEHLSGDLVFYLNYTKNGIVCHSAFCQFKVRLPKVSVMWFWRFSTSITKIVWATRHTCELPPIFRVLLGGSSSTIMTISQSKSQHNLTEYIIAHVWCGWTVSVKYCDEDILQDGVTISIIQKPSKPSKNPSLFFWGKNFGRAQFNYCSCTGIFVTSYNCNCIK